MTMDRGKLERAVEGKWRDVHARSYEEAKEHLKDVYGAKGWIGAMAQAVTGSATRSGKEYSAARRSIERFESGQYKSSRYAQKAASVVVVDRRLPGNQMTITVKGKQPYYPRRDRSFSYTFHGADAYSFAEGPSYQEFFHALDYPDWLIDAFDEDSEYGLDVSSVA